MLPIKILIVGIVLVGLFGTAVTAVVATGGNVLDGSMRFRGGWGGGGCGGGGCGGYDRDDGGYPSCHRNNDQRGSCYVNGTCQYYDNRTS